MLLGDVFIWVDNPVVQPGSLVNKLIASLNVATIFLLILLLDELFVRMWNCLVVLKFVDKFKTLTCKKPELSEERINKNEYQEKVNQVRLYFRGLYCRYWGRKVRSFLITDSVSDVEQLPPRLTDQLWQEDRGTLLL